MLLDTPGLYACSTLRSRDTTRPDRSLTVRPHPSLMPYVLAELVPLCQVRGVPRATVLEFVSALLTSGEIEVYWADRSLHEAAHQLLFDRPDKTYSLCDAASFILMKQRHEMEALTTDSHFEQEGFVRLLPL